MFAHEIKDWYTDIAKSRYYNGTFSYLSQSKYGENEYTLDEGYDYEDKNHTLIFKIYIYDVSCFGARAFQHYCEKEYPTLLASHAISFEYSNYGPVYIVVRPWHLALYRCDILIDIAQLLDESEPDFLLDYIAPLKQEAILSGYADDYAQDFAYELGLGELPDEILFKEKDNWLRDLFVEFAWGDAHGVIEFEHSLLYISKQYFPQLISIPNTQQIIAKHKAQLDTGQYYLDSCYAPDHKRILKLTPYHPVCDTIAHTECLTILYTNDVECENCKTNAPEGKAIKCQGIGYIHLCLDCYTNHLLPLVPHCVICGDMATRHIQPPLPFDEYDFETPLETTSALCACCADSVTIP